MVWKILISILLWIIYIIIALSIIFAVGTLLRVLIWNKIKRVYCFFRKPKQQRDILEQDPFEEKV